MATQPINKNDIIKDGAIESIIKSFETWETQLKKVDDSIVHIAKSMDNIKPPAGAKDFKELAKNVSLLEQGLQNQNQINKEQIKTQQEIEKLRKAKLQADREEIRNQKILNSETKNAVTEYQKMSRALTAMRNEYKELAVKKVLGNKLTKDEVARMRELEVQIKRTDKTLKDIDASTGQFQRSVGNYEKATGSIKNLFMQFTAGFGVVSAIRGASTAIMDYDDALKNFRIIVSDLNDNQFQEFKDQIKSIAETTGKSSTEVAQSFKMIAGLNSDFAKTATGLGMVSEGVITLSKAGNMALDETASSLTGVMNQFNLGASETDRVINVLAAGQAVGAASVTELSESYKNAGAVMASANISLENSVGIFETLAKFGIKGAEAGTQASSAIANLQKAQLGYSTGQFNVNEALEEFNTNLAKLKTDVEKDEYALKIFGKTGITAGKILTQNTKLIDEFTKGVTGTTEAQRGAEIASNTLSAKWEELKNNLVTMVTTSDTSNGALEMTKNILGFLAENIGSVVGWIGKLVIAFTAFKIVMASMKLANHVKEVGGLKNAISGTMDKMKEATGTSSKLGSALKGIGWTVAIGLAVDYAMALYQVASGAKAVEDAERRKALQMDKSNKIVQENIDKLESQRKYRLAELNDLLNNGKITKSEYDKQVSALRSKNKEELSALKSQAESKKKTYEQDLKDFEIYNEKIKKGTATQEEIARGHAIFQKYDKQLDFKWYQGAFGIDISNDDVLINHLKASIEGVDARVKAYSKSLTDVSDETKDFSDNTNNADAGVKGLGNSIKKTTVELINYDKKIRDMRVLTMFGADDVDTDFIQNQAKILNDYYDEIERLDLEAKDKTKKQDASVIEYRKQLEINLNQELKKLDEERAKARLQLELDNIEKIKNAQILRSNIGISQQELDELTAYYSEKKKIEESNAQDKDKLLEELEKKHQDKMNAIRRQGITDQLYIKEQELEALKAKGADEEQIKALELEIIELKKSLVEIDGEIAKVTAKSTDNVLKKITSKLSEILNLIKEQMNAVYDSIIASQNKLIDSSQRTIDLLRDSAVAGNLQARESILAEEKAIRESQARIEKAQKRKQRLELITTGLNTFNTNVQNLKPGESPFKAVAETIGSMTAITAWLSAFSFDVGADRLGYNGNIDGKGGFPATVHPNERILTAKQNKIIGYDWTNKEITSIMDSVNRGLLLPYGGQQQVAILKQTDNTELLTAINNGFSKINNFEISIEELFSQVSMIVKKTQNGNVSVSKKILKN